MVLDPLHYLATLDRKPGALDHAPVFRDWKLPACFTELRAALELCTARWAAHAASCGVLQLLDEHPLARVLEAVEALLSVGRLDSAEAVIQRTRSLAAIAAAARGGTVADHPNRAPHPTSRCRSPDLSRFNQLRERPGRREPRQCLPHLSGGQRVRTPDPTVGSRDDASVHR